MECKIKVERHEEQDSTNWLRRSEYWLGHKRSSGRGRGKKFRYREPFILCGDGVRIRVDHGTLLIRNGFTHYPQKCEEIRLFPGDANMPDRIVVLDGSGGISFDALNWMSDQQVVLVQLNWRGQVSFVGGNSGYSANPKLVELQKNIRESQKASEIACWLILEKITASIKMISEILPESKIRDITITRLNNWRVQLKQFGKSSSIPRIMGIEGAAAAAYFQSWQGLPLKWVGSKRRPIPDNWRTIGPRTMGWRKTGQNARHPINAMLNYGYGVLVSELRTAVTSAGFDPGIAIMHGTKQNKIPLVYDLMEPLRPLVDGAILRFSQVNAFASGDFTTNKWGGCRLNPQLARQIAILVSTTEVTGTVESFVQMTLAGRHTIHATTRKDRCNEGRSAHLDR